VVQEIDRASGASALTLGPLNCSTRSASMWPPVEKDVGSVSYLPRALRRPKALSAAGERGGWSKRTDNRLLSHEGQRTSAPIPRVHAVVEPDHQRKRTGQVRASKIESCLVNEAALGRGEGIAAECGKHRLRHGLCSATAGQRTAAGRCAMPTPGSAEIVRNFDGPGCHSWPHACPHVRAAPARGGARSLMDNPKFGVADRRIGMFAPLAPWGGIGVSEPYDDCTLTSLTRPLTPTPIPQGRGETDGFGHE